MQRTLSLAKSSASIQLGGPFTPPSMSGCEQMVQGGRVATWVTKHGSARCGCAVAAAAEPATTNRVWVQLSQSLVLSSRQPRGVMRGCCNRSAGQHKCFCSDGSHALFASRGAQSSHNSAVDARAACTLSRHTAAHTCNRQQVYPRALHPRKAATGHLDCIATQHATHDSKPMHVHGRGQPWPKASLWPTQQTRMQQQHTHSCMYAA